MDSTYTFRKALLRRLLDVVGAAALVGPAITISCGAKVAVDRDGGTTGLGGSGGAGGTNNVGSGFGGGGGGSCTLTTTGVGGAQQQITECFAPPPDGCPKQYDAVLHIIPSECVYLVSVDCGPVESNGKCCYLVTEEPKPCGDGRPFVVDGEARTAPADRGDHGWTEADLAPALRGLDAAARAALAEAWTADALFEHASVASFSRFALELMAAGAPADLLAAAHRAALDEVRHARLCFALAGGYRGEAVSPAPFPFGGTVAVVSDLPAMAAATARDGCIGETVASLLAAEQLARATDPAVRRTLAVIAEDEARHAELAWRAVAWALDHGGEPVRAALREVFDNAGRHFPIGGRALSGITAELAAAHGRLDPQAACRTVVRGLTEVVLPCARALLDGAAASPLLGEPAGGPVTQRSSA
ncbi:MAG: ferritin-like domain-containing protein [Minicystis sp.]